MVPMKGLLVYVVFSVFVANIYARSYHGHGDGGNIKEESSSDTEKNEHGNDHGHAYSYQHFVGPVVGDHEEITWKDKHGHHDHDYKAHPKYAFSYGVDDHHTKDSHGQKEHRDGKDVEGEYHIHEPGGNIRTVKYHADHHGGFFAEIHNYGGNDHSGGTYGHKHR